MNIIEKDKQIDLYTKMLSKRKIFLYKEIDRALSTDIISQLMYLDDKNKKDIYFYINSPGGELEPMLGIYDIMCNLRSNIHAICYGSAYSAAAILLSSGTRGRRYAYENSRIMIHQPWTEGGAIYAKDLEIKTKDLIYLRDILIKILSKNTGKKIDKILKDIDRDNYMSAQEALSYGIIDHIIKT